MANPAGRNQFIIPSHINSGYRVRRSEKTGNMWISRFIRVSIRLNGKRYNRMFSVDKYGFEKAYAMAENALQKIMRDSLAA